MKLISDNDIMLEYKMSDAISDIEALLKNMDEIKQESRIVISTKENGGSMIYMPCVDLNSKIGITKIASITPENNINDLPTTQAIMILTDLKTGEHIATIEANYLTKLRTGALSGIATKYLSRENSNTIGLIGTGGMAYEQLIGNLEVRKISKVYLYNKSKDKAKVFKEKIIEELPHVSVEITENTKELVENSDIINCQTRSTESVFNAENVKVGTHINGIGSFTPEMREIDYNILLNANKVIFDDFSGVKAEAGEFIEANNKGVFKFEDVNGDLKDLVTSESIRRSSEKEITVFKSVGTAYFDLAVAIGIYNKIINN
ncbi:TPA: ornithine cyclodeaminase family protein [Staphylococcus aureus]|nr:ornithine cyclodeaminase family protein [Staphylococcus aureus]HDM3284841.1 ornithine cyclodeaminase family protein [Staphylococcus aureus]HDM3287526.1 ornithine cyclodeaminase family protein [Staphylococcus aureus]HDM3290254.1 ornithine cyclodeaminase family protein [Staphylococcus aureus]HDM3293131.1 ornithine cyclodeaminase family protein [Staphylococcus aureus]